MRVKMKLGLHLCMKVVGKIKAVHLLLLPRIDTIDDKEDFASYCDCAAYSK